MLRNARTGPKIRTDNGPDRVGDFQYHGPDQLRTDGPDIPGSYYKRTKTLGLADVRDSPLRLFFD